MAARLVLQTIMGTTFAGNAFISSPVEVVFKDFVPGRTYTQKVSLINRGFTKNSIRLVEVPVAVAAVMDVEVPPVGYLAPGTSCDMTISFRPKSEAEDITTAIPLLAETGPLAVAVRCLIRKVDISIDPCPVVEVGGGHGGGVMVADSATRSVTIHNAGALSANYELKVGGEVG